MSNYERTQTTRTTASRQRREPQARNKDAKEETHGDLTKEKKCNGNRKLGLHREGSTKGRNQ